MEGRKEGRKEGKDLMTNGTILFFDPRIRKLSFWKALKPEKEE